MPHTNHSVETVPGLRSLKAFSADRVEAAARHAAQARTPEAFAAYRAEVAARRAGRAKADGTADRRLGARTRRPEPSGPVSFGAADYAVSLQHTADLADAGMACSLEQNHLGRPEVWSVVHPARGTCLTLWRAGGWTVLETVTRGHVGEPTRRRFRSIDAAWNDVRVLVGLSRACFAAEAGHAAAAVAQLPAWLTVAQG